MPTALITGANRGIGLALAARYAAREDAHVIAVARELTGSEELHELVRCSSARVRVLQADLANAASIEQLGGAVGSATIDVLVNNAGVGGRNEFGTICTQDLIDVFSVNTFAPLLVTQALRTHLTHGAKVINISSILGSIETARECADALTYSMSKAALNMFSMKLAKSLRPQGIVVIAMHPGGVRTRMGGSSAPIDVDTSAQGMMRVIDGLKISQSGTYFCYDGSVLPW
jgi:NAD(P)-dependent dehydrogenase (short-subunit alcohol dehydrogenase family)